MRIGVYVKAKNSIEPVFHDIDPNDLLDGETVKEALERLRINEMNFDHAVITAFDRQHKIPFTVSYWEFEKFAKVCWYIRFKLIKERRPL